MFKQRISFKNAEVVVEFPRSYMPSLSVVSVVVYQKQGSHDVALLSTNGYTAASEKQLSEGAPVKITWSSAGATNSFYGYVHNVTATKEKSAEIMCVNASFILAKNNMRSWTDKSATQIVKEVCLENGLSVDSEEGSRKYPHVSQEGISDWQLLRRLADESGYVLRAEGTTILFVPRFRIEEYFFPNAPVLTKNTYFYNGVTYLSSLIYFEPTVGEYKSTSRGELSSKVATYVSTVTGEAISISKNGSSARDRSEEPLFKTFVSSSLNSASDADASLNAAIERDRFRYTATAKSFGNPRVVVERPVYINDRNSEYSGYWTVLDATHEFSTNGGYVVKLLLGTDTLKKSFGQYQKAVKSSLEYRLSYPYPQPILDEYAPVEGRSGKMFKDFSWKSTNRKHR